MCCITGSHLKCTEREISREPEGQWTQEGRSIIYNRLKFRMSRHPFNRSTSVCTSALSLFLSLSFSAPLSRSISPSLHLCQGHHPCCCYHGDKPRRAVGETCEGLWVTVCVCAWACLCKSLSLFVFLMIFQVFLHICFLYYCSAQHTFEWSPAREFALLQRLRYCETLIESIRGSG